MSQLMKGRESKVEKNCFKAILPDADAYDIVKGESVWNVKPGTSDRPFFSLFFRS